MKKREKSKEPYGRILATRLPESLDRRRKLPTSEHDYIRKRHVKGESQRQLARAYGVSRRLIIFILHPERLEAQKKRKHDQKYSQKYYYAKIRGKKWRETMKEHRHYKVSIKDKLIK